MYGNMYRSIIHNRQKVKNNPNIHQLLNSCMLIQWNTVQQLKVQTIGTCYNMMNFKNMLNERSQM